MLEIYGHSANKKWRVLLSLSYKDHTCFRRWYSHCLICYTKLERQKSKFWQEIILYIESKSWQHSMKVGDHHPYELTWFSCAFLTLSRFISTQNNSVHIVQSTIQSIIQSIVHSTAFTMSPCSYSSSASQWCGHTSQEKHRGWLARLSVTVSAWLELLCSVLVPNKA